MAHVHSVYLVGPPAFRAPLAAALERAGRQLVHADDAHDAVEALSENSADVVIVAHALAHRGAHTLAAFSRSIDSPAVVIVIGAEEPQARAAMLAAGADDCLPSAVDPAELHALVDRRCSVLDAVRSASVELAGLRAVATVDPETGLDNERGFRGRLSDEFRRALRYDEPLVLLMVEIEAPDTPAALTGQAKDLGAAVRRATRETDHVARLTSSTFAALLPNTPLAAALTVAERICSGFRGLRLQRAPGTVLAASVGLGGFPSRGVTDPDHLVKSAAQALLQAKSSPVRIALHRAPPEDAPKVGLGHS